MCDRILGEILTIVAALGLAAGEHHPVNVPAAERGRESVRRPLNPPFWSLRAYQEAWKRWGLAKKPADYDRAFRALRAAPSALRKRRIADGVHPATRTPGAGPGAW